MVEQTKQQKRGQTVQEQVPPLYRKRINKAEHQLFCQDINKKTTLVRVKGRV